MIKSCVQHPRSVPKISLTLDYLIDNLFENFYLLNKYQIPFQYDFPIVVHIFSNINRYNFDTLLNAFLRISTVDLF